MPSSIEPNPGPQARELSATITANADGSDPRLHAEAQPKAAGVLLPIVTQDDQLGSAAHLHDHPGGVLFDVGWEKREVYGKLGLVEGLHDEDFWKLVRRFNKQIFHLKVTSPPAPGGLDFIVSADEDFSPNKLRAQFERLYMGLMVGMLAGMQHLSRLRSWKEPRRTGAICLVYVAAWALNLLIPGILISVVALILRPNWRHVVFPPVPISMVDYQTGGLSGPHAGILGSTDTATGAPENSRGEALENEASNFVTGIAAIPMNVLTDEDPQHTNAQKGGSKSEMLPSPNELATKVAVMKDKAAGVDKPSQDKTKVPVEELMWSQMKPMMHMLCLVSDTWERLANMLCPTPPFLRHGHKYRLAGILAVPAGTLILLPNYVVSKAMGIGVGVAIFGDPLLGWANRVLDLSEYDLTNTLFRGVPTDAQLAITLLRLGEARNAPLPPPLIINEAPPTERVSMETENLDATGGDEPLGATDTELQEAADGDVDRLHDAGGGDQEVTEDKHGGGGKRKKLFDMFKLGARGAAKTVIAADKVRAKTGSDSAKARLGATAAPLKPALAGPLEFHCSYDGKVGFVFLTTDPGSVALCFSEGSATDSSEFPRGKEAQPKWIVPVASIVELNKFSGYGTKAKMMAGWALDQAIMDGLEIVEKGKKSRMITAMPRRDQLFNRLCALGQQSWEIV